MKAALKYILVGGLCFIFGLAVAPSGNAAKPVSANVAPAASPAATAPTAPTAAPQVIDPKVLANAVDNNKVQAAAKYNNMYVQITSKVTDISTAFSPSVSFGNVSGKDFSLIQIICYPAEESELIPFNKDQVATVRGTVEVGYAGVIKLNDCQKVG